MALVIHHEHTALPYERAKWAETVDTLELLNWVSETFGKRAAFGTAFGREGCALIDLSSRHNLNFDFFTLDTGYFFPETLKLWKDIEARYDITIRSIRPALDIEAQDAKYGEKLYERDSDSCCYLRKVKPLDDALKGKAAWLTGLRREQSPSRSKTPVLEWDTDRNLVKVNPLAAWSADKLEDYLREHEVLTNPLHEQGYPSVGCHPCTSPVKAGESERSGRWRGSQKTECGLHIRQESTTGQERLRVLQGGQP